MKILVFVNNTTTCRSTDNIPLLLKVYHIYVCWVETSFILICHPSACFILVWPEDGPIMVWSLKRLHVGTITALTVNCCVCLFVAISICTCSLYWHIWYFNNIWATHPLRLVSESCYSCYYYHVSCLKKADHYVTFLMRPCFILGHQFQLMLVLAYFLLCSLYIVP